VRAWETHKELEDVGDEVFQVRDPGLQQQRTGLADTLSTVCGSFCTSCRDQRSADLVHHGGHPCSRG
jgi:hypothetical protein